MADPRYSRTAFWIVKMLMILAVATWLVSAGKESGRQEILSKRPVQMVMGDTPYCYNGSFYQIVEFNYKKMSFRVKKGDL